MKFFKVLLIVFFATPFTAFSQRFFAEKSQIRFFSDGIVEDISAENTKVTSIFDAKGDIAFLMSMKDFQFEKKLMQVHFNEKYMESEKFPKSSFQGKISGFDPSASGQQPVKATGKLSIHGVTKDVEMPGTIEVAGNQVLMKSTFKVKLIDYNIKVPQIVWQNIAQEVEVSVDLTYRPL
ncbi:MAG TPA: YceI family protein [Ohtaekwangia sp.]|nr:YceI family protein [Ohtaekwangia sp.]